MQAHKEALLTISFVVMLVGVVWSAPQSGTIQTFRDIDDLCMHCICQASTGCRPTGCNNMGGVLFCGPFQISQAYWQDGGQPRVPNSADSNAFQACATNQQCSESTVRNYLLKYVRNCNEDTLLDCEDIARLHKAGPFACNNNDIIQTAYWTEFQNCYYGKK